MQGLLLNDQRWLNAPYCFASLQRSQLSSLCLSLFYLALGKGEEEFYDFTPFNPFNIDLKSGETTG